MVLTMSDMAPTPILPPSPPSETSIVLRKLRRVPGAILGQVRRFNNWSATKLRTTPWRVLQLEILGFGLTMIQIGEYAVAITCWVILAILWVAKVYLADNTVHPFRGVGTFIHAAFAVIVCVLLITMTTLRKPEDEPWSNLQKIWSRELPKIYRYALQTPEFVVNADEHYDDGALIAGIPWKQGSVLTRLQLQSVPNLKLYNVELRLTFDATFMHGIPVGEVTGAKLEPVKRPSAISDWEGGSLDKNGNKIDMHSATPEDLENFRSYPAQEFIFKQSEMSSDLPVTLAFVGGSGYRLGNFTFGGAGPWIPHGVKINGHYEVRYKNQTYTVPVDLIIHPQARGGK